MNRLVIHGNDVYEALGEPIDGMLRVRQPYCDDFTKLIPEEECQEWPRTWQAITKKWIPDCVEDAGYLPQLYLLEILTLILTPKFLSYPKELGCYMGIWLNDKNEVQVANMFYCPDELCPDKRRREQHINVYIVEQSAWAKLIDLVSDPEMRYLRFVPTNIRIVFPYLLELVEKGHLDRDDVERIWRKDRKK